MYKNQLQELAQRSCFNLPSYTCIREGPDHAPRFKATVYFNGQTFECPTFCTTLRQAEHSAAEIALTALALRRPSNSLAAKILDETGVYKNLLQEVSQRVGSSLPAYKTFRSGLGHLPVFTCTVELGGFTFTGEPAKNKKQAEKNAATVAWSSLKQLTVQSESSSLKVINDEQEHVTVARALQQYRIKVIMSGLPLPMEFPTQKPRPPSTQPSPPAKSKILPLICPKTVYRNKYVSKISNNNTICQKTTPQTHPTIAAVNDSPSLSVEAPRVRPQKFPAAGAAPYIPVRHYRAPHRIAPPVTIRNAIPVFSAPPLIPRPSQTPQVRRPPPLGVSPPVCIRLAVPAFTAPPVRVNEPPVSKAPIVPPFSAMAQIEEMGSSVQDKLKEAVRVSSAPLVRVMEPLVSKAPVTPARAMAHSNETWSSVPDKLTDALPVLAAPAARVEAPPVPKSLIDPLARTS